MSRLFLLNKRADYAEKPTPSHVACVVCNVVMLSLLPTHYVPLFVLSGRLVLFSVPVISLHLFKITIKVLQ